MSEDELDANNRMAQQKIKPSAFETTFRPQEQSPTQAEKMAPSNNEFDHKENSSPLGESPQQQYGDQIDQDKDSVLTVAAKAT